MLTRKEKLLFFCLGRTTTPYEAAERWEGKKATQINMGPWYACKSELLKERLIEEIAQEGREKLIRADLSAYLNRLDETVRRTVHVPLFSKFAPKIVNFIIQDDEGLPDRGTLYYPVMFFLAARLMIGNYLQALISTFSDSLRTVWGVNPEVAQTDAILKDVRNFIQELSRKEQKELRLEKSERRKIIGHLMALLRLAPGEITKKMLIPMMEWSLENSG